MTDNANSMMFKNCAVRRSTFDLALRAMGELMTETFSEQPESARLMSHSYPVGYDEIVMLRDLFDKKELLAGRNMLAVYQALARFLIFSRFSSVDAMLNVKPRDVSVRFLLDGYNG